MITSIKRVTLLLFSFIFFSQLAHTQEYKIFKDLESNSINTDELFISPQIYRMISLNADIFFQKTSNIPNESEINPINSSTILSFPLPDGSEQEFRVVEYSMMENDLAASFPNIKTYFGVGLKNPSCTIRFDYTAHGLRAVLRLEEQMVYIDPVDKINSGNYVCYYRKDLINEDAHTCHLADVLENNLTGVENQTIGSLKSADCRLKRYTIAMAATAEYSAFYNATSPTDEALVLSAITTSINRVNEIYENDLGIRLVLANGTEALFYYNAASDPYTNNNPVAMLTENQTNITSVIGTSNFDIGHVVGTSNGGVASINSPCRTDYKARGVTGLSTPQGDVFDIDFLCHEIGHQFGANHTFNNSCSDNVNLETAIEPGSGSTIMGYAGTCAPNVQANSDAYFHTISLSEIDAFINGNTGSSCVTIVSSTNNQPEADAGKDVVIPHSTPFYLEGGGTDVDGDLLTFCWEQMNNETSTQSPISTSTVGPNFRSFLPTTNSIRYFPNLSDLSAGALTTWEVLPAVSRDLDFRLTVRDNNITAGGCFAYDDMLVSVDATAGPFEVTVPNNSGITWVEGTRQTVTWNVANTDASPINCSKVDILLSYDGGLTYPTIIATNVDNDGSVLVTIPAGTTSSAKVMVKSVGNVFFDISNNNFTIAAGSPDFSLSVQNPENNICGGDDAIYDVIVGTISGFSETILLSISDAPAGVSVAFSSNPVSPGDTLQLTISNTSGPANASYTMSLNGSSLESGTSSLPKSIDFVLILGTKPGNTVQISPTNNEEDIMLRPTFNWNTATNANSYELQVSTDPSFASITQSQETTATSFSLTNDLESATSYFWRVRGLAECGGGEWSIPLRFTTYYCTTYVQSTDMPVNDNGDAYSVLTIIDEGTIALVEVLDVVGSHTWVEDITTSLISPGNTEITLWSNLCRSKDDFSLSLKDNAANSLANVSCDPLGGGQDYQPEGALSAFSGSETNGDWQLKLNDNWSGETGTLLNWSLKMCILGYTPEDSEGTALPLDLLSFSAKEQAKTIMLDWKAINEKEISGYEIERRELRGEDFSSIGFVELKNTQNQGNEYSFEDENVEKGLVYQYRLRMLDYSGVISYSTIEEAQISKEGLTLNIYPNPARGLVSIDIWGELIEDVAIEIIDIAGRRIAKHYLKSGNNVLDISNLSNGVFIVRSIGEQNFAQHKLVVN